MREKGEENKSDSVIVTRRMTGENRSSHGSALSVRSGKMFATVLLALQCFRFFDRLISKRRSSWASRSGCFCLNFMIFNKETKASNTIVASRFIGVEREVTAVLCVAGGTGIVPWRGFIALRCVTNNYLVCITSFSKIYCRIFYLLFF